MPNVQTIYNAFPILYLHLPPCFQKRKGNYERDSPASPFFLPLDTPSNLPTRPQGRHKSQYELGICFDFHLFSCLLNACCTVSDNISLRFNFLHSLAKVFKLFILTYCRETNCKSRKTCNYSVENCIFFSLMASGGGASI